MQVARFEWTSIFVALLVSHACACGRGVDGVTGSDSQRACGGHIAQASGNLASPRGKRYYYNWLDCRWNVTSPTGSELRLEFLTFDLEVESKRKCDDAVRVQVDSGKYSQKYCGKVKLPVFEAPGGQFQITFTTDRSQVCKGFSARWFTVPPTSTVLTGPTEVDAGVEYTWTCVSSGSNVTAPTVSFRDGYGHRITQNIVYDPSARTYQNNVNHTETASLTKSWPLDQALVTLSCHAIHNFGNFTTEDDGLLDITVMFPSNNPVLTGPTEVKSGIEHTWTCVSTLASTVAPTIGFLDENGNLITQGVTTIRDQYKNDIHIVTANLRKQMPDTKAGVTLRCHAEHTVDNYTYVGYGILEITICNAVPMVTRPGDDTVVSTEDVQTIIPCNVIACSDTAIQWTYGDSNTPIDVTSDDYENGTLAFPSLVITSANYSDRGTYVCRATNSAGEGMFASPTTLVIRYKPRFEYPKGTEFEGEVRGSLTLPCIVHSFPYITSISWKLGLNGSPSINISESSRYSEGNIVPFNLGLYQYKYDLTIYALQKSDFDTEFFCEAVNSAGSSTSAKFTVKADATSYFLINALVATVGLFLLLVIAGHICAYMVLTRKRRQKELKALEHDKNKLPEEVGGLREEEGGLHEEERGEGGLREEDITSREELKMVQVEEEAAQVNADDAITTQKLRTMYAEKW